MDVVESLLKKTLKIEEPWEVTKVEFIENESKINIYLDFPRGSVFKCPQCELEAKAYDTKEKVFRHLNFFQYECYLIIRYPRIKCKDHGVQKIKFSLARDKADFTYLFESFALTLCREMPVNKVSQIIKADDNKLWRMIDYYIQEARKIEDYQDVKKIGIDETSMKKKHNYVTLCVDLEKRKTIFVTQGKDAETMKEFKADFIEHKGKVENIKDISIDMSPAFIKGAKENFPEAEITFDKFHIIKIINKALDEVRREEVKKQSILKGQKYLLLKNRENLTEKQIKELEKIEKIKNLNLKTIKAYHIKENFKEIYKEKNKIEFENGLKKWYFWASHSRIKKIIEMTKSIKKHWAGIIKWFDSRINNGILEGLNSMVQAAKNKARGYKSFKYFKNIIYLLTGKLDFSKIKLPT